MSWTDSYTANQTLLLSIVALPGVAFGLLSLFWLLGWNPPEKVIGRITAATYAGAVFLILLLALNMNELGATMVSISPGQWFEIDEYEFPLTLLADRLSIPMMALTAILTGLIGAFSRRYLHREKGFERFFLLLNLFGFGSILIFAAGSFDLLIGG